MTGTVVKMLRAVALLATVVLGGCGSNDVPARRPQASSPSISISPTPTKTPQALPDPVAVEGLPTHGVAISADQSALLVGLNGEVLRRLRGFTVAGNPGAPGVWLQRGRNYFRLDVGRGRLMPVARGHARNKIYDEGPEPNLSPPPGTKINGHIAGRWRYAYRSGERTLAQWSGECEVPTAFWVEGGTARIVTGEDDLTHAPESIALGWSPSGGALIHLGEGACGTGGDPPGLYSFSAPGEGTLLYETTGFVSADMW